MKGSVELSDAEILLIGGREVSHALEQNHGDIDHPDVQSALKFWADFIKVRKSNREKLGKQ